MLGIDGKVVMPKGAPKSKVAATCDYSAEVILHGDNFNDTIAKVSEIVEMEGRIFIPPYDDAKVIAGQGTIGLEIMEDLYDVDNVIVPIGGGGLIAGIAVAIKSINPTIRIIGVQSENVHGMAALIMPALLPVTERPALWPMAAMFPAREISLTKSFANSWMTLFWSVRMKFARA
jgi:threonine dehydratase